MVTDQTVKIVKDPTTNKKQDQVLYSEIVTNKITRHVLFMQVTVS